MFLVVSRTYTLVLRGLFSCAPERLGAYKEICPPLLERLMRMHQKLFEIMHTEQIYQNSKISLHIYVKNANELNVCLLK